MTLLTPAKDSANLDMIERMLLYLGLHEKGFGCPDPMFFDNAVPAFHSVLEQLNAKVGSKHSDYVEASEKLAKIEAAGFFADVDNGFSVVGCRPLAHAAKQRLISTGIAINAAVSRVPLHLSPLDPVLQIRCVDIDEGGKGRNGGVGYMAKPGGGKRWYLLAEGPEVGYGMNLADFGFSFAVAASTALKTMWAVDLRFSPVAPGLRFATNPTGIREFFKFRDVPEGKTRRAALRDWVRDHWRAVRCNPEDEVYVRTHLRGATSFKWHGYEGTIHVPEASRKEAAEAVARRKRMPPAEARRKRAGR